MIISMIVSAIVNVLAGIVKGIFSMIFFFIRMFWKLIRLLLTILPVTGCLFTAIYLLQAADLILKRDPLPSVFPFHPDYTVSTFFFEQLATWWNSSVTGYRGTPVYYLIVLFALILTVPVLGSLLFISSFRSAVLWLTVSAGIDLLCYLLRSIVGKVSPFSQITDRFYALFPDVGDRHYDRVYRKWLRRHHEDFEDYDDEDCHNDHYRDEDDNDYYDDYDDMDESEEFDPEDSSQNFFSAHRPFRRDRINSTTRRKLDRFYEDSEDEYDEEDEADETNDYTYRDDNQRKQRKDTASADHTPAGNGFDFFAGCTSPDSAERKYHTLVKLYHPDNMDGDTNALQEINIQYDKIKKRLR